MEKKIMKQKKWSNPKGKKSKSKRTKYIITGVSPTGEGFFKKTVYSKKATEWYKIRGYTVKKVN